MAYFQETAWITETLEVQEARPYNAASHDKVGYLQSESWPYWTHQAQMLQYPRTSLKHFRLGQEDKE